MSQSKYQLKPKTKIIRKKNTKPIRVFSCRVGSTHSRIDDLYICPPNIILDLFRLLVISYSCVNTNARAVKSSKYLESKCWLSAILQPNVFI